MELDLNKELETAQRECEKAFADWNTAKGKLEYIIALIQKQAEQSKEDK